MLQAIGRIARLAWAGPILLLLAGCGYSNPYGQQGPVAQVGTPTPAASASASGVGGDTCNEGANLRQIKFPNGISYADIKTGNGARATLNSTITADYTLFLASDCSVLDSSKRPGGQKIEGSTGLLLGQSNGGGLIDGFVYGVEGMKVGGVRRVFVNSANAYGPTPQNQGIPPNANLIFIVSLEGVTAPSPSPSSSSPSPSPS